MFILEVIGTISFAISGAIAGIRKGMDLLGIMILSIITATGGGAIRDITLGITPPTVFIKSAYLVIAIATCTLFLLLLRTHNLSKPLYYHIPSYIIEHFSNLSDAIGLGVFTVSGVAVALNHGYNDNIFLALFVGVITGVGGGIMRDVLTAEIPSVFVRYIYALASLIGATLYYVLRLYISDFIAMIIGIVIIVIIRMISRRYKLSLPKFKL